MNELLRDQILEAVDEYIDFGGAMPFKVSRIGEGIVVEEEGE